MHRLTGAGRPIRELVLHPVSWRSRATLKRFFLGEYGFARAGGLYRLRDCAEGSVERRAHEERACLHCLKTSGVAMRDDEDHMLAYCTQTRRALTTAFPSGWRDEAREQSTAEFGSISGWWVEKLVEEGIRKKSPTIVHNFVRFITRLPHYRARPGECMAWKNRS